MLNELSQTLRTYPSDFLNGDFSVENRNKFKFSGLNSCSSFLRTFQATGIVFLNCLITCICYGVLYNVNTNGFLGE